MEPHGDRIVRITLAAADLHCRDDLCVGPVLVVVGADHRLLRLLLKADDAKAEGGFDV